MGVAEQFPARSGLLANVTSSGIPAISRRSSPAARSPGRYRDPADEGMPARGGEGEGDLDLAECGAAHGAAVLARRPSRIYLEPRVSQGRDLRHPVVDTVADGTLAA